MNMNHVSFPTRDVPTEVRFFVEHLGARLEFVDDATGTALMRHGAIDIVIEAMKEDVAWHRDFHFGFELSTRDEVVALHDALRRAGVRLETEVVNRSGRGSRFMGRTPGGIQFEVATREDRVAFDPSTLVGRAADS